MERVRSLLTPHNPLHLARRVWAWPGWPWLEPGRRRQAGFWSPVPECERPPTSAADIPPSATLWRSAGPVASYWSAPLDPCSAASWCPRSEAEGRGHMIQFQFFHVNKSCLSRKEFFLINIQRLLTYIMHSDLNTCIIYEALTLWFLNYFLYQRNSWRILAE